MCCSFPIINPCEKMWFFLCTPHLSCSLSSNIFLQRVLIKYSPLVHLDISIYQRSSIIHGITDSQNCISWKRQLRSAAPTIYPSPSILLTMSLDSLLPMPHHSLSKKIQLLFTALQQMLCFDAQCLSDRALKWLWPGADIEGWNQACSPIFNCN